MHNIHPGQIILTGMMPYPDGTMPAYRFRPYLVIGISSTHIETLIVSSLAGKEHKASFPSNYRIKQFNPPLLFESFVKLDSYQKTELSKLIDLRIASNGITLNQAEFQIILKRLKNYKTE